jgi:hypothetical protein
MEPNQNESSGFVLLPGPSGQRKSVSERIEEIIGVAKLADETLV